VTRKKRILYIEDDALVRAEIGMLLEMLGYEVALAGDAEEARQRFHETPVDLVITDQYLPRGSGTQLLHEFHQERADLPVIVLTGYPSGATITETILEGGYTYLAKPVTGEQLKTVIEHALAAKK
jgi:DNA-binding NtrC family response regulator